MPDVKTVIMKAMTTVQKRNYLRRLNAKKRVLGIVDVHNAKRRH